MEQGLLGFISFSFHLHLLHPLGETCWLFCCCLWCSSSLKRLETMTCRRDCLPGLSCVPKASPVVRKMSAFTSLLRLTQGLWRPLGMGLLPTMGVVNPHCGMKAAPPVPGDIQLASSQWALMLQAPSLRCPKTNGIGMLPASFSAPWEAFLFRQVSLLFPQ